MMICQFDWDEVKAASNLRKHGVAFETAMTIFADPLMLTIFDPDHSETEERWVSIGHASDGQLVIAVHTYTETGGSTAIIRVISARRPTKREARQYREGT
jgi:uncharacterized DUF497 family protein